MVISQTHASGENRSDAINAPSTSATYNPRRAWNPIRLSIAFLTRMGWHVRAYGTVLGLLLLTLVSLIVLQVCEFYRFALHRFALHRSVRAKAIALSNHDSVQ